MLLTTTHDPKKARRLESLEEVRYDAIRNAALALNMYARNPNLLDIYTIRALHIVESELVHLQIAKLLARARNDPCDDPQADGRLFVSIPTL